MSGGGRESPMEGVYIRGTSLLGGFFCRPCVATAARGGGWWRARSEGDGGPCLHLPLHLGGRRPSVVRVQPAGRRRDAGSGRRPGARAGAGTGDGDDGGGGGHALALKSLDEFGHGLRRRQARAWRHCQGRGGAAAGHGRGRVLLLGLLLPRRRPRLVEYQEPFLSVEARREGFSTGERRRTVSSGSYTAMPTRHKTIG